MKCYPDEKEDYFLSFSECFLFSSMNTRNRKENFVTGCNKRLFCDFCSRVSCSSKTSLLKPSCPPNILAKHLALLAVPFLFNQIGSLQSGFCYTPLYFIMFLRWIYQLSIITATSATISVNRVGRKTSQMAWHSDRKPFCLLLRLILSSLFRRNSLFTIQILFIATVSFFITYSACRCKALIFRLHLYC